jgi:hypothetical protein
MEKSVVKSREQQLIDRCSQLQQQYKLAEVSNDYPKLALLSKELGQTTKELEK